MKRGLQWAVIAVQLTAGMSWAAPIDLQSCPPAEWTKSSLLDLAKHDFAVADETHRNQLAINLQACLLSRDPTLRDGVAYTAYQSWLRSAKLSTDTRLNLLVNQLAILDGPEDKAGFARPFAALVLAELARADAVKQELGPAQRNRLLVSAVRYLGAVTDYRSFDPAEGWWHGVAHGADLLMQLSRHPSVDQEELMQVLDAVATKIAPDGEYSYVSGEPERLARPIIFIALREIFDESTWREWFERISSPKPFTSWDEVFTTRSGLAKRHNTRAFLLALYVAAQESEKPALRQLLKPLRHALKALG